MYVKISFLVAGGLIILGIINLIFFPEQSLSGQIFVAGGLSIGLLVFFIKLFRIDIQDRNIEESHREYFKKHGRWPS